MALLRENRDRIMFREAGALAPEVQPLADILSKLGVTPSEGESGICRACANTIAVGQKALRYRRPIVEASDVSKFLLRPSSRLVLTHDSPECKESWRTFRL